jgi:hypothetical protein
MRGEDLEIDIAHRHRGVVVDTTGAHSRNRVFDAAKTIATRGVVLGAVAVQADAHRDGGRLRFGFGRGGEGAGAGGRGGDEKERGDQRRRLGGVGEKRSGESGHGDSEGEGDLRLKNLKISK